MSKTFALLVSGSPHQSQAHLSAQRFVEACYAKGHNISCVFFYGDAVYVANGLMHPANDEQHPHRQWRQLAERFKFTLNACVSVSSKRGVLNQEDSQLAGFTQHNVDKPFEISGLGAWVEASINADRTLHFA
ncbi:MAG: sulfurtransferase complex subunit TusD [Gammaproteobacteria bacterium]|nr:sulfurtransferase complex subunit TusD [Gammaproteobacteria bacterium]NVK87369.1 sulfurtransferase complex subunit TusD [Gammaproteobacteria bacterium]